MRTWSAVVPAMSRPSASWVPGHPECSAPNGGVGRLVDLQGACRKAGARWCPVAQRPRRELAPTTARWGRRRSRPKNCGLYEPSVPLAPPGGSVGHDLVQASRQPASRSHRPAVDHDDVGDEAGQQVQDERKHCGPNALPGGRGCGLGGPRLSTRPRGTSSSATGQPIGSRCHGGSRSWRQSERAWPASGRCARLSCWTRRRPPPSGHACSTIDRRGTTAGLRRASSSMMANSRGVKSAARRPTKAWWVAGSTVNEPHRSRGLRSPLGRRRSARNRASSSRSRTA